MEAQQTTQSVHYVTQAEWQRTHADYKLGTAKREPRMLRLTERGTVLAAVVVTTADGSAITEKIWRPQS